MVVEVIWLENCEELCRLIAQQGTAVRLIVTTFGDATALLCCPQHRHLFEGGDFTIEPAMNTWNF